MCESVCVRVSCLTFLYLFLEDLKPPLDLAGPWIKTIIGPNWDSMDSRGCLTTQMADIYRTAIIVISATLDDLFL